MLTIEEYLSDAFQLVRIDAQLEELRRISTCVPPTPMIQDREDKLYAKRDKIKTRLDKEFKPVELAPVEQYIEVELQYMK